MIINPYQYNIAKPKCGNSRINWGNPLTSRLAFAALFNEETGTQCQNLVNQNRGVFTGSTKPNWKGSDTRYQGNSTLNFPGGADTVAYLSYGTDSSTVDLGRSSPVTFAWRTKQFAAGGTGAVACRNDGNTVSPGWQLEMTGTSSIFFTKEFSAANCKVLVTLPNSLIDRWGSFVLIYFGDGIAANVRVYYDGLISAAHSTDNNGSGTTGTDSAETLYVGRSNANFGLGKTCFSGKLDYLYMFNRAISLAEVYSLHLDPYGMFNTKPQLVFQTRGLGGSGGNAGKGSSGKKGGGGSSNFFVPGGASYLNIGNSGIDIGSGS